MAPSPHSKKRKVAVAEPRLPTLSVVKQQSRRKEKSTHSRNDGQELHAEIDYAAYTLRRFTIAFAKTCVVTSLRFPVFTLIQELKAASQDCYSHLKVLHHAGSEEGVLYDKAAIRVWAADLQNVLQIPLARGVLRPPYVWERIDPVRRNRI
jgi:hypothetical protein